MWDATEYTIKQKVLTIGKRYYILDGSGRTVGFAKQKMFKLKEDIRVYSDESQSREVLRAKQEQIMDFNATLAVTDGATGELVGYVGRKGWASLMRDTWRIFGPDRAPLAEVREEGGALAILRRVIEALHIVPKTYYVESGGERLATIKQKFQLIGDTWRISIHDPTQVDTRLVLMSALLMDMIEQNRGD